MTINELKDFIMSNSSERVKRVLEGLSGDTVRQLVDKYPEVKEKMGNLTYLKDADIFEVSLVPRGAAVPDDGFMVRKSQGDNMALFDDVSESRVIELDIDDIKEIAKGNGESDSPQTELEKSYESKFEREVDQDISKSFYRDLDKEIKARADRENIEYMEALAKIQKEYSRN